VSIPIPDPIVNLSGQYWFGSLGIDPGTKAPLAKRGTVSITGNQWDQEWDDYSGHNTFSSSFTTTEQPDGSINVNFPGETYNIAWNGDVMIHAGSVLGGTEQGFDIFTRIATNVDVNDVLGDHSYFGYHIDSPGPGDSCGWGDFIFDSNGTAIGASTNDRGNIESGTMDWSIDEIYSTITISGSAINELGYATSFLAEGGIGLSWQIVPEEGRGDLGYAIFIKKTGQMITMADIADTYQIRFLETGPGAVPYTCGQGTCVLGADGSFSVDAYYSNGEHDVFSTDYTVGPGNEVYLDGGEMEGIISPDKNLIFLPEYRYENPPTRTDDDWLGGIFLIRMLNNNTVPGPGGLNIGLSVTGNKLPTAVVSGSGAKISLTALIENVGEEAFDKGSTVDIYFYARETTTSQYTEIGSLPGTSISNLEPGTVKKYSINAQLPAGLADGVYEFVVEIGDDAAVVENHTVAVQEGFIDFTMAVGNVSLPSAVIAGEGAKMAIQATVTNTGNISTEKTAMADFTVVARPASGGDDIVLYETTMKFGNLKPGSGKKYNLKPTIPSDVPEDTYDVLLWCDYGDVGVELPLDHQMVVSEPFVDLSCTVGSSSGSGMIIPGTKSKIKIPVNIINEGNVPLAKTDTVDIYVYLREIGDIGNNDILVGSMLNYKVGALASGKPKILSVPVSIPATAGSGDYQYVAVVDSNITETNANNNEMLSSEGVSVVGGFLEMTRINGYSNASYTTSVKGDLLGYGYTGILTVNVSNSNGNITETVTSKDGFDTQQQTYNWYQNSNGICLGSFGQEVDMGTITFDFDNLVVFPADGSTGGQSNVDGLIEIEYGWNSIDIDLTGTATAKGQINGVKTVKVNGTNYDAVESKISLIFDAEGSISDGYYDVLELQLDVKQDITYWTTSIGIIKSQIETTVKVNIPGEASASGSSTETREMIGIP
jgi:hypothetical protein